LKLDRNPRVDLNIYSKRSTLLKMSESTGYPPPFHIKENAPKIVSGYARFNRSFSIIKPNAD